jgi:hypothetical protein
MIALINSSRPQKISLTGISDGYKVSGAANGEDEKINAIFSILSVVKLEDGDG